VLVTVDETTVLVTVVGDQKGRAEPGLLPAVGELRKRPTRPARFRVASSSAKARPSEKETLTSRLIDRPMRPLFPKGFRNEVQVVCTVMSVDQGPRPGHRGDDRPRRRWLSGIPFDGPIGAARVGFDPEAGYLLNPNLCRELRESALDMVVAGTKDAVLMVESEAKELPKT
jgi:polyribonucleotide nucleotidyltransferase